MYFLLQQYLADLGSVYLVILGAIAILVMLLAPRGLWGLIMQRWNLAFFPVQLRVRVVAHPPSPEETESPKEPEPMQRQSVKPSPRPEGTTVTRGGDEE